MRLLVAEWVSNLEFLTQLLLSLLLKLAIKNTIQTLCLQFQCDISSAEVQQGLALSASLLTSSKVPYYGFPLQRKVGSSHIALQKLAPDRNELLNPGSSSDNLSETDVYLQRLCEICCRKKLYPCECQGPNFVLMTHYTEDICWQGQEFYHKLINLKQKSLFFFSPGRIDFRPAKQLFLLALFSFTA